ncbi:hypothetical protein ARMGADRAFT_784722 [Armillaria gallica]|uniref:Uncharacterized protein n=1 Tax=Armillaria gallica TaxID=47427 RepID=A0A2H3D198_ARMGA|nr:hypothetical protein ARMGADRAFT_784722 [Armillaria gallica]
MILSTRWPCSTSTGCARFITHLGLETDMGAYAEGKECGECARGVWKTSTPTSHAGRWTRAVEVIVSTLC